MGGIRGFLSDVKGRKETEITVYSSVLKCVVCSFYWNLFSLRFVSRIKFLLGFDIKFVFSS